jgi:hypothetical protein
MLFLLLATAALPPVHAHAQEQSANEAAQPSEAPQAETGGDAVVVSAGAPGDWIEADSGSYLTGDKLELRGNVILHTESAFPGAVIEIRADLAIWDEKSGIFSVPGTTSISVPTYELELHGEDLSVNMGKRTGSLDAVDGTLHFDPKMFADENGMVNRQYVRFTTDDPVVSLISEGMSFVTNADGKLLFTFKRARLAPTDAASADFRIAVQEMLYTPGADAGKRDVGRLCSALPLQAKEQQPGYARHSPHAWLRRGRRPLHPAVGILAARRPGDRLEKRVLYSGPALPARREYLHQAQRNIRSRRAFRPRPHSRPLPQASEPQHQLRFLL